jgi:prepilin-type N-terminal cleavage/methylation domain-containing protein
MKKNFKNNHGFTLIELIISVFILSIAIVGIFGAFSIMIILTSDAADRLTATYLAQEGIEIVRNIRDTNWLNMDVCSSGGTIPSGVYCPSKWVDGLTSDGINGNPDCSCSTGDCNSKGCKADYTTGANINGEYPMTQWSGGASDYLKLDASGFYNQSGGTTTQFKRKILITPLADANNLADHIVKVEVQVSWNQKATVLNGGFAAGDCEPSNCIAAETILYDWYNYSSQQNIES